MVICIWCLLDQVAPSLKHSGYCVLEYLPAELAHVFEGRNKQLDETRTLLISQSKCIDVNFLATVFIISLTAKVFLDFPSIANTKITAIAGLATVNTVKAFGPALPPFVNTHGSYRGQNDAADDCEHEANAYKEGEWRSCWEQSIAFIHPFPQRDAPATKNQKSEDRFYKGVKSGTSAHRSRGKRIEGGKVARSSG
jgi:hypothetical protein